MSKPRIRHNAIVTTDPARLAEFYERVFEMEVLHRAANGSVFMTDGNNFDISENGYETVRPDRRPATVEKQPA